MKTKDINNKELLSSKRKCDMKKIFLFFVVTLILINFASAQLESLGTFKQNEVVRLAQVCSDATKMNISSVTFPNSTRAISNVVMSSAGSGEFYYNFTNTSLIGRYDVRGISDGTCEGTFSYYFIINQTGEIITNEQSTIYIIALIFLIILALGLYFLITRLPNGDSSNEEGMIVQVSMLKHLRPILWVMIWLCGLACIFIISNLGLAYLPNAMIGNLFFTLYRIMFYTTMIGVPVYFIWVFYKIFRDKELQKMINRGADISNGY